MHSKSPDIYGRCDVPAMANGIQARRVSSQRHDTKTPGSSQVNAPRARWDRRRTQNPPRLASSDSIPPTLPEATRFPAFRGPIRLGCTPQRPSPQRCRTSLSLHRQFRPQTARLCDYRVASTATERARLGAADTAKRVVPPSTSNTYPRGSARCATKQGTGPYKGSSGNCAPQT